VALRTCIGDRSLYKIEVRGIKARHLFGGARTGLRLVPIAPGNFRSQVRQVHARMVGHTSIPYTFRSGSIMFKAGIAVRAGSIRRRAQGHPGRDCGPGRGVMARCGSCRLDSRLAPGNGTTLCGALRDDCTVSSPRFEALRGSAKGIQLQRFDKKLITIE